MAYEVGNWKISKTSDSQGNLIDDTEVLMKRPDGQPCNIQAQYIDHYTKKGYKLVDDYLDFPDRIPATIPESKPVSRDALRAERDARLGQEKKDGKK